MFNYVFLCVWGGWGYVQVSAGTCGGQRQRITLELELQVVVVHLMWVLGTTGFSARAALAGNHRAIFLVLVLKF